MLAILMACDLSCSSRLLRFPNSEAHRVSKISSFADR